MKKKIPEVIIVFVIKPALIFAGLMCIWYFLAISNFIGYISTFNTVWIYIGVFLILFTVFLKQILWLFSKMHRIIKAVCLCLVIIFLSSFFIIESLVFINARSKNTENADYIIILGAGLYRGGPSLTLLRRINVAVRYANDNPDVKIIVSGGTGQGQRISEAAVMSRVLQNNGIDADRIIIEDKSTNTFENLKFSGEIISGFDKKVLIASSEFHLFRAKIIASRLKYKNVGVLASRTPRILLPTYYLREYFAVIKTIFVDS